MAGNTQVTRRTILSSTAMVLLLGLGGKAGAAVTKGTPAWTLFDASPPELLKPKPSGEWYYFTDEEAETMGAMVERLIPADDLSVSGKDAGCVEFMDRQLAGFFGNFERLYMQGPFKPGIPEQGDQSPLTPRMRYRVGIAALNAHCSTAFKLPFAKLAAEQRDDVIGGLQSGRIALEGIASTDFFALVLSNTMEGFFADPIYGGNRDMVSWKMIGFPGARYDYRNYIDRHGETFDLPPLSIAGRPEWNTKG